MLKVTLTYDKGTIVIRGLAHIPFATLDPRTNVLRALGLHYSNIIQYLKQSGIEYSDYVLSEETTMMLSSSLSSPSQLSLRDYQHRALENWLRAGLRGCLVLPTGSGKTIIGIKAIEKTNASSLIVVPTLDLMDQWTTTLSKYFPNLRIGNLGGGNDDIQSITVSTYDSAYIRAPFLGNKFSLVIFDEVHHLALGYRTIAEQMAGHHFVWASPLRLKEKMIFIKTYRDSWVKFCFKSALMSLLETNILPPMKLKEGRWKCSQIELEEVQKKYEHLSAMHKKTQFSKVCNYP